MKTKITFLIFSALIVASCGNQPSSEEVLKGQVDSLTAALDQRNADYDELDQYLTVISVGLDSITKQESEIFNTSKESSVPNREEIQQKLSHFKETLKEQRERITTLEAQLSNGGKKMQKLQAIVVSLKAQLVEKESQIEELQQEVESKDFTISILSKHMNRLTKRSAEQQELIEQQGKIMQEQDNAINEGFVKIASKSELKKAGLLSGGNLLKKSKVDYASIDKSLFQKIDTRVVTEIVIDAKNPKVLTQVPADTYTLVKDGKKTILRITNPTRFWNVSKFLIIQAD